METGNARVRRGLGLLAIGGVGLVLWVFSLALIQAEIANVATTLLGLVAVLATLIGLIGGLGLLAVGLLRGD